MAKGFVLLFLVKTASAVEVCHGVFILLRYFI